jgi:serine/threonine protein kinase
MLGPDHQQKQHHHQQQQQQQQDEQQLLLQQARAAHVDRLGRAVDLVLMAATALQHQELLQGVAHMRDCLRAWDLTQVERMLDGIPWAQVQDWCRQLVQAAGGPQQADADMQQRAAMAAAAAEGITAVIGAGGPPPALGGAGPGGPGPQQQLQPLVANYEQLYQHVSWLRILTAAGPGAVSLAAAARQRYDLFGGIDATHTYVSCLLFSPAPGPLQAAGPALDAAMQHVAYDMQLGLVAGYAGTCPDVPWRDVAYLLHTYQGAVDGALGSTLVQEGDVGIALHLAHQRQLGFHLVALGGLCNVLQDRAWEAVATNPDMQPYLKRMADAAAAVQANRQILAQTRPLAGYHGEPKPGYTLAFTQGHAPQLVETVVAEPGAPVLQLLLLSLLGVGGYGSVWMIQPLGEEAWRQLLGLPPGAALPRELAVKLPIASKKARDGTPAKECDDWRVGRSLDRLLAEANREVRALQRLRMLPYVTDLLAVGLVQLRVAPTEGAAPEEVELPMLVMEASLGSMWDLQHNQGPLGVAPAVFPDGKVPEPFIKYFLLAQLVAKVGMGVLRVLHRDWKTANLLVSWANGRLRVKVSDLGLGKLLDGMDASLPPLTHAGTPGHVGPEVIHGRVQGHSMDMFSIGITGLEMAYGQSPLRGLQHWARPGEDVVDPAAMDVLRSWLGQAHEGISDPLLDFCTWLCSQDPVKRPSAFKAICSQFFAQ